MSEYIIALDAGNTKTAVGCIDANGLRCIWKTAIATASIAADLSYALRDALHAAGSAQPLPVTVCSVGGSVRVQVEETLAKCSQSASVTWVAAHSKLPITIAYTHPETLGPDRIADLLYGQAASGGRDCIIIDSGTAIKIDCLKNGCDFIGGVILPGIGLQFKALHTGTSVLPQVASHIQHDKAIGTSTEECILAGVIEGTAGAIDRIVMRCKELLSPNCCIIATGGAWGAHAHRVTFPFNHVPDATLIGTALFR